MMRQNPNYVVPTAPPGTNNNQAASTAFVQQQFGTGVTSFDGRSGAVVPTAGDYTSALINTTSPLTGSTLRTQLSKNSDTVSVRDFGAIGNGVADDTAAIQAAINAVQIAGGQVFIPAGSYKITTALAITSMVSITGVGYQGDQINAGASTGYKASVLVCGTTNGCFSIATNGSVLIEKLQIVYPSRPSAGIIGIFLDAAAGAGNINTYSTFRDIHIIGADIGFKTGSAGTFCVDHCNFQGVWTSGADLSDLNFPGSGDSTIVNCVFSAAPSSALLIIRSGGGLRVENNKFNSSTTNGANIIVTSALTTSQSISPLLIVGNSIENAASGSVGILAQQTSGNMQVLDYVISSNEFLCATGILVQANVGLTPWFIDGVIANNLINCTSVGISIDTVGNTNIVGNMIFGASLGFTLGTHNSAVKISGNNYGPGTSPPAPVGPALPATTVAGTNTNPFAVMLYISGGTVTAILVNSISTGLIAGSFLLNPGDTFQVNYSAAPGFSVRTVNP